MAMKGPGEGFFERTFRVARTVVPFLAMTACDPRICEEGGALGALPVERCNAVVISRVVACLENDDFRTNGGGAPRTMDQCLDEVRQGFQEQAEDLRQDCLKEVGEVKARICRDRVMTCLYRNDSEEIPSVKDCFGQTVQGINFPKVTYSPPHVESPY